MSGFSMIVDAAAEAASKTLTLQEMRVLYRMIADYQDTLQKIAASNLDDFSTLHPMSCSFEAKRCLERYGMLHRKVRR